MKDQIFKAQIYLSFLSLPVNAYIKQYLISSPECTRRALRLQLVIFPWYEFVVNSFAVAIRSETIPGKRISYSWWVSSRALVSCAPVHEGSRQRWMIAVDASDAGRLVAETEAKYRP
jgi:hypothetical protein